MFSPSGQRGLRQMSNFCRQGTTATNGSSYDSALERLVSEERAATRARNRAPSLSNPVVRSAQTVSHGVVAWIEGWSPFHAEVPGQVGQSPRPRGWRAPSDPLDPAAGQPEEEAGVPDVDTNLRNMVALGNATPEGVQPLLASNADLNAQFSFCVIDKEPAECPTALRNYKCFCGSVLALAAMHSNSALVSALVRGKANLESKFSFRAGRLNVLVEQTIIFAAVAKSSTEVMLKLVQLRANLDAMGSMDGEPNNTLLWQACYFGRVKFVRYLLSRSCKDLEVVCRSQDEDGVSHTPLHTVAKKGDVAVARELIAHGAKVDYENEAGETPLTDAISHDHHDIIRVLVAMSADVLSGKVMEKLFGKNNMVTITAAAEGLVFASEEYITKNLSIKYMKRFLTTQGDAAMRIIHIAFRPRSLNHLDDKRKVHKTAHIPHNDFNVAVGPDATPLRELCRDQQEAQPRSFPRKFDAFYTALVPRQDSTDGAVPAQVPIDVYQCIVEGIHHSVDVLHAIATSKNDRIFNEIGCQAIVELGWRGIRVYYILSLLMNMLFALHLLRIVAELNGTTWPQERPWRYVKHVFLVLPWLYEVMREFLQALGVWRMGKLRSYFDVSNYVDFARLLITGYVVYMLSFQWDTFGEEDNPGHRVLLSVVCFFRWMQVLNNLNGFQVFGTSILPIQKGAREMPTFIGVVLFPAIGSIHAYFAFGIYGDDVIRTIDIMYRLAFIGHFSLKEMENVEGYDPESTWRVWVRVLLLFVSFFVTLTMMNIFIAVVGEAYMSASHDKYLIFWQNKAGIVFTERAILEALRFIFPCSNWVRAVLERAVLGKREEVRKGEWPEFDYVWFVKPKDEAISCGDGVVDDIETEIQQQGAIQDMDEMKKRLHGLEKDIRRIVKAVVPTRPEATGVDAEPGAPAPQDVEALKLRALSTHRVGGGRAEGLGTTPLERGKRPHWFTKIVSISLPTDAPSPTPPASDYEELS